MGRGSEPPGSGVHDEREDHPDPGGSGFGYPPKIGVITTTTTTTTTMTKIRPLSIIKVVGWVMACWCLAVGVSPFVVGAVGGKGGVVMMMVRWMDGLWAHPVVVTTQIERGACPRALVVPDLGSYPSQAASWRNGSLRKVTTTTATKSPT